MTVTIYHNPDCGASRNTLAMIRQSGVEPTIIEYLNTPPSREIPHEGHRRPIRALLREKGTPFHELGLADPKWSDGQLIDQILAHPILINRPIVVTTKGTTLCRPSEAVLELLIQEWNGALCRKANYESGRTRSSIFAKSTKWMGV